MIFGRLLILKNMPHLFEFSSCTTIVVPVWVILLGLLVDLWNIKFLDKLGSRIGEPLMHGSDDRFKGKDLLC